MKAYKIDVCAGDVTEVDYDGSIDTIYKHIACDVFTIVRFNDNGDVVFIDDDGLLKPFTFADMFMVGDYPQPLVGSGLVLGTDASGESVQPSINLDQLKKIVRLWPDFNPMKVDADTYDAHEY